MSQLWIGKCNIFKMKHLKTYKSFNEDTGGSGGSAGSGDVSNPQPGALPGDTGTTGSGDVSFYLSNKKKKRIRKGNPSQVSDLRFLAPVKTNKIKESYTEQEYQNEVEDGLKKYNIRPLELNRIMDFYQDDILDNLDNGQPPITLTNKIVKDLELDSGGFMSQRIGMAPNQTIKYL